MYTRVLIVFGFLMIFSCKAGMLHTLDSKADEDLTKYMYKPKGKAAVIVTSNQNQISSTPVKFEKQVNAGINALVDSMAISNKRYQSASGYRIMVYSGSSSEESSRAKKTVYDWSTEHDVYAQYKQPAFRVKVGNFPDRIKAYDVLSDILKIFPNAVIIPDQIEIK